MIAEQRDMIVKLQNEKDTYKEITRILLRENLDLKDTLDENEIIITENLVDLKKLFSSFGDIVVEDEGETDEEKVGADE